jgi:hypothetical protein
MGTKHTQHIEHYFTDDLEDDMSINTVDKAFTITVTAQDDAGINNIRVEWMNGDTDAPTDAQWATARTTTTPCPGGSCVVCREGVNCPHPDIKLSELSLLSGGAQNVFWFRVIVTDNSSSPKAIKTGWDEDTSITPVLDKQYNVVICGAGCHTCSNAQPSITSTSVTDRCASSLPPILNWTLNAGETQS